MTNILSVLHDFRSKRIFVLRYVIELFEHGEVAVAFNIAHCPWISIPVPGATKIAAALNHSNVGESSLAKPTAH